MLYVTTREQNDAYTAHRTIVSDIGPDGGRYLPFRMPRLDEQALEALTTRSFTQNVAELLNQFFSCRLTGWDIELCTGRYPVRCVSLNRKILIGEMWHNVDWDYDRIEKTLGQKICASAQQDQVTSWVRIAIRICVLFGLYGEMRKNELVGSGQTFDISVPTGDFGAPIAVYYARQMGLPVGTIICACNENGGFWELLHLGELRTDTQPVRTQTPLADFPVPPELERLICGIFGTAEAKRFAACCGKKQIYTLLPDQRNRLREGIASAVVSGSRVNGLIRSEYATSGYILGPYSALTFGALTDVRAKTRESRTALILAERSPICDEANVSAALDIPADMWKQKLLQR